MYCCQLLQAAQKTHMVRQQLMRDEWKKYEDNKFQHKWCFISFLLKIFYKITYLFVSGHGVMVIELVSQAIGSKFDTLADTN